MPKRTEHHRRADRGVQKVKMAFADAGWACDEVLSDYGEDLVAQTSLSDIVDPYRILAQVKTTAKAPIKKTNSYCFRVDKAHLRRWIRNPDFFIFVLWVEALNKGFWVSPAHHFCTWELDHMKSKTIQLSIPDDQSLDAEGLKTIEWEARINNWNKYLIEYDSNLSYLDPESFETKVQYEQSRSTGQHEVMNICGEFLSAIDFLCHSPIGTHLKTGFFEVYGRIVQEAKSRVDNFQEIGLKAEEASMFFILYRIREISTKVLVPARLLEFSTKMLAAVVSDSLEGSDFGPDSTVI